VFLEVVVLEWDKHLDQCLNRNKEILWMVGRTAAPVVEVVVKLLVTWLLVVSVDLDWF
jgi:hypothetical protein